MKLLSDVLNLNTEDERCPVGVRLSRRGGIIPYCGALFERLDRLRLPCRIIHSIGVVVPHRNLPERRPPHRTSVQGPVRFVRQV
jgi:hypothetical protein